MWSTRWRKHLIQNPFDDIALLLCGGVLVGYIVTNAFGIASSSHAVVRGLVLSILLALFIGVGTLETLAAVSKRRSVYLIGCLLVRVAIIELANIVDGFGIVNILYLVVPMKTFLYLLPPFAWGLSLVTLCVFFTRLMLVKPQWFSSATVLYTLLLFTAGLLLASYSAQLIARERRSRMQAEGLLRDLETSHQRLARYASQAAETATLEERNRLARDIHDGLGHYLTAINIQLEKAAVFHVRSPEESLQSIRDARRMSSEALDDVRQSVSSLRDSTQGFKLEAELRRLVERAQNARLAVALHIEGDAGGLPRLASLAVYRAAQEALTNVQRHAQAAHAVIHLHLSTQKAVLTVTDDGRGFDVHGLTTRTHPGKTYGLLGVRERLTLVGGQLDLCSTPGKGTVLTVCIPRTGHPAYDDPHPKGKQDGS